MVTTLKKQNSSPDHKNQLWSQINHFAKVFSDISKKDIYKCPKWKNQKTFGKII
jgi:inorganic pyrophosphatase